MSNPYLPPGCTQMECDQAQPGYWDEPNGLEWIGDRAYWRGRLVFDVVRERTGWKLYRYSTVQNRPVFKSKEAVRNRSDGVSYAEGLSELWPSNTK